jgi:hypothetical protein
MRLQGLGELSTIFYGSTYPQEYHRSLPLKGLQQRALSYQEYVELMKREASTQQRLHALGRWNARPD